MLAALNDGTVLSWGASNLSGQLGRAGFNGNPQPVPGVSNIVKVSAGGQFSLAVDDAGQLFGWGLSTAQQLVAPGTFTAPIHIPLPVAIRDVAAGASHTVAIAVDGSVWAWGGNQFGQAGRDPNTDGTSVLPAQVPNLANIIAVAAGANASFAVASDGALWAWGRENEIGVGSSNAVASHIPRQVILFNGNPLTDVTGVAAGSQFAVASRANGQYAFWGSTTTQRLGFGSNVAMPSALLGSSLGANVGGVGAGDAHAFLIVADPPSFTQWSMNPTATCNTATNMSVNLNSYSLAGLSVTDVMLVLDESGSLNSTEFGQLKSFASNFVSQLDMNTTRVGIVMFDDEARLILAPSGIPALIQSTINGIVQGAGNTCIGCGLNLADQTLDHNFRAGASRYIVLVTDGVNNRPTQNTAASLNAAVQNAHQQSTVLSVGVGNQIDVAELTFVASTIPGFTTVFTAADFSVLDDLVIDLVRSVIRSPGAPDAQLDVDLGPSWEITSGNSSVGDATFTKVGSSSFSWLLPRLDAAGATLQLVVRAIVGGVHDTPASETYSDARHNGFVAATPAPIVVTGCPALFTLTPAESSSPINTVHAVTATLKDDFGTPLSNQPVKFTFVGGLRSGITLGTVNTNFQGVATMQFSSFAAFTEVVQASLVANPSFVSNTATHVWLPPNAAPVAHAGADQSLVLSGSPLAAVMLDGSASTDDGERQPLSYSWSSDTGFSASGAIAPLSLPFGVHIFTLTVNDGEFSRTDTVVITISDTSPPVVIGDVAGTRGKNGWFVSDLSVSFSFEDPESGIATTNGCAAQAITKDTTGDTFTCTVTNGANLTGSRDVTIKRDATPPVVTPHVNGLTGNNGWHRSDVEVSFTVTDPQSGIFKQDGCDSQLVSDDTTGVTFTCTASNFAGGSTTASVTIRRDVTPPIVTPPANVFASADTSAGAVVSYTGASATDTASGIAGPVVCAPASGSQFPIGATHVTCAIDDAAGNAGSATFDVTVGDTTPPSITSSVSGTPGSNGWFTSPVQIVWTVSDPQSSATASGCDPVTVSADTPGVTITCSATSAGGSASASAFAKIDQTAPVITTPGNLSATATSLAGGSVSYSVSASDPTSGLAGAVSCAPASGSTFPIGTTPVNCSASNNAGQGSQSSFTVTVNLASNEPGKMHGNGHVTADGNKVSFEFDVIESAKKGERGKVDLHIGRGRSGESDDERFEARAVSDVVFSNAPSYSPGKDPKSGIDTVIFTGTGRWDRQDGYSYIATASDRGEPGRGVDTFNIEVKSPNGQVVFTGGGAIGDGNVQSNRVKR